MADTIYLKGEGGTVWPHDLPLHEAIEDRLVKGQLVRVAEDGSPFVDEPAEKPLTNKERLQADATALGLDTGGTVAELTERINAKVAELRKQAGELNIDTDELSPAALLAAIDEKLGE
ncbi:hypothetical protein [Kibdelosporangium phytohabitans]|uniref:Uncharacterized protein n=1 Tax=Kibdelosporangium phytohabitans TaxID=860235 RepID=A0A0N9HZN0_9PSEU|nr:hypothetical protein [Kibdelosporangium phytohabitans]ALG07661.1 hypothetical protein AOZ06_12760 [Kibdelosporangium phytohabitans]ALG07717.1 hypothetical protein AOZ06_13080 [Kibdelosporangium phytohabitans]MBE1471379.1 hypothetical protein [Kibdelosporangium phytohabitans]